MGRKVFPIALAAIVSCQIASATIINVPGQYATIQAGIDSSASGDTVLVAPGTYNQVIDFTGKNITVGSQYLITGDTSLISSTIIQGDSLHPTVKFANGEDSTAAIIGFTVHGSTTNYANNASGLYCLYSSPVIANNIIKDHYANKGGGINITHAHPMISNNLIIGNQAYQGGGIYAEESLPIITGNIIRECYAGYGGGINCFGTQVPIIVDNLFEDDSAFTGGAVFIGNPLDGNSGNAIFYNNILHHNHAMQSGGGLIFCHGSGGYYKNNIIYDNGAHVGAGIYACGPSSIVVSNCIFWGNSADSIYNEVNPGVNLTYCDIQGEYPGQSNIDMNPLFRNPAIRDFHLMSTACGDSVDSPCIDAGDPDSTDSELGCLAGLGTLRIDLGVYGGGGNSFGPFDGVSDPIIPTDFLLSQNYPNPFNPITTISYNLPNTSPVSLEIYDILGRKVETLVNENQPAGPHQAVWNAAEKASGIYFYRLEANHIVDTKRMLLLK